MKRIASMALAAATMIAPLATAQQYGGDNGQWSRDNNGGQWNRNGDNNDGQWNRDGDNDGRDRNGRRHHHRDRNGDWNNNGYQDGRSDYRQNRGNDRWDRRSDNGYTWNGRWNYGPPPSAYYGQSGYAPGYRSWRRGDRLPDYYRNGYQGVDYRSYNLRPPPYGYRYVRDDRGDILLVGILSGLILSTILSSNY